ncbi:MAG TPA: cyanophycin synthetase [Patescibacteria group bacterium]|nr:cyanophycin synthetase [Patescibacteria group bacterium]
MSLVRRNRRPVELGAGLASVRPSRPIRPGERIHVVGVAGAGASAAALHARAAGAIVSGCDPGGPSPYTPAVEAAGIPIAWRHDPSHVTTGRLDRLAVTKALTAIQPDHPELEAARAAGVPLEPWQQLVADAAHGRRLVAVAGTHGKSTTAGWLTWILTEAGVDPSAFVGALLPASLTGGIPATARIGAGKTFVVEADEYAGNFDAYLPDVIALTTIEWDHPDVFTDRAAVIESFAAWLGRVPTATVVANLGDSGVVQLLGGLQADPSRVGPMIGTLLAGADAGPSGDAQPVELLMDARIGGEVVERSPDGIVLAIDGLAAAALRVHLPVAGDHNAANALVALATGLAGDVVPRDPSTGDRLLSGLATFPGVGRRLERKGEARGVVVYDDYGHHPTAIRATLQAIRQREPDRRVWVVYEPLTFHRTAAMLDEFAEALAEADAVAVADIWASRDPDTSITSSEALATSVRKLRPGMTAVAPGSVEATARWLADNVAEGDAVLVMGGGKSYRIAELLLEHLSGDR